MYEMHEMKPKKQLYFLRYFLLNSNLKFIYNTETVHLLN